MHDGDFGDQAVGLEKSELKVHGVTGNHLTVLGQKEIEINIGGFLCNHVMHIVDNMADNVFILGRDILNKVGGIVDYQALE